MDAVVTTLCLPVLARGIPRTLSVKGDDGHPMASLFAEREALGLPFVLPDVKKHKTLQEAFLDNLVLAGFDKENFSENIIQSNLLTICPPMAFESGDSVGNSYVLSPEDVVVEMQPLIDALESKRVGLGETVMYWIEKANENAIPGWATSQDAYSLYQSFELQDCETDEDAREFLIHEVQMEEPDLSLALPSAVKKTLGGDMFLKPKKRIPDLQLLAALKKAGVRDAKRLDMLLRKEFPSRCKAARKSLSEDAEAIEWIAYYFPVRLLSGRAGFRNEIDHWFDRNDDDRAQQGDPSDALYVQRAGVVMKGNLPTNKVADGLKVVAKMLNAWSSMDELLTMLSAFAEANPKRTSK